MATEKSALPSHEAASTDNSITDSNQLVLPNNWKYRRGTWPIFTFAECLLTTL
jgi:hypothetical protein